MNKSTLLDENGFKIDATFSTSAIDTETCAIFLESRSGTRGTKFARNTQYEIGLDLMLARLASVGAVIRSVQLAPATRDSLIEVLVPERPYPWILSSADLDKSLGAKLRRAQAGTGRIPGSRGQGNHTKRIRLVCEISPSIKSEATLRAVIESGRVTPGPDENVLRHEYRPAIETTTVMRADPFSIDPSLVERGFRSHAETQNLLAAHLTSINVEVFSPGSGEPDYDIAWRKCGELHVGEVKSLTQSNEERQLRLGLGQVLRYAHQLGRFGTVRPFLIVEKRPEDATWVELCSSVGVTLLWPEVFVDRLKPTGKEASK